MRFYTHVYSVFACDGTRVYNEKFNKYIYKKKEKKEVGIKSFSTTG